MFYYLFSLLVHVCQPHPSSQETPFHPQCLPPPPAVSLGTENIYFVPAERMPRVKTHLTHIGKQRVLPCTGRDHARKQLGCLPYLSCSHGCRMQGCCFLAPLKASPTRSQFQCPAPRRPPSGIPQSLAPENVDPSTCALAEP